MSYKVYSFNRCSLSEGSDDEIDEVRVFAVDWLLLEPLLAEDALRQGNAVVRFFIAEHKPQLAGRILEKVRNSTIYG